MGNEQGEGGVLRGSFISKSISEVPLGTQTPGCPPIVVYIGKPHC